MQPIGWRGIARIAALGALVGLGARAQTAGPDAVSPGSAPGPAATSTGPGEPAAPTIRGDVPGVSSDPARNATSPGTPPAPGSATVRPSASPLPGRDARGPGAATTPGRNTTDGGSLPTPEPDAIAPGTPRVAPLPETALPDGPTRNRAPYVRQARPAEAQSPGSTAPGAADPLVPNGPSTPR